MQHYEVMAAQGSLSGDAEKIAKLAKLIAETADAMGNAAADGEWAEAADHLEYLVLLVPEAEQVIA